MFLSEWREFPSAPCLAGTETWWQLASRFCWNRARPWHSYELVSFLVGLRTYQHPGNIFGRFALLFLQDSELMTILKKHPVDASIWNVTRHVLRNTHWMFPLYLKERFTIYLYRYNGNGNIPIILDSHAPIVNFFFDLSSSQPPQFFSFTQTTHAPYHEYM